MSNLTMIFFKEQENVLLSEQHCTLTVKVSFEFCKESSTLKKRHPAIIVWRIIIDILITWRSINAILYHTYYYYIGIYMCIQPSIDEPVAFFSHFCEPL